MAESFFEAPILNSPYDVPKLHHALDEEGQPLDVPPVEGRRSSELITPVPKPRKRRNKGKRGQESFVFEDAEGLSSADQEYNPTPIINEIRSHVASWRDLPNPADWGVTPTTARLPPRAPMEIVEQPVDLLPQMRQRAPLALGGHVGRRRAGWDSPCRRAPSLHTGFPD